MSHSSLLGDDDVPMVPPGHSTGDLGPSDLSDTGSDMVGTGMTDSDSDSSGTGERDSVRLGHQLVHDICPDEIVSAAAAHLSGDDASDFDLAEEDGPLDPDVGDPEVEAPQTGDPQPVDPAMDDPIPVDPDTDEPEPIEPGEGDDDDVDPAVDPPLRARAARRKGRVPV